MEKYPHIFTEFTIRSMTMKNRIAMLPMGSNMGGVNGDISDEHILYYEARARGGTGLIIIENACVDAPQGLNGTTQLRIDHDRYIPRLSKLTETLHKYHAAVSLQINHAGAGAVPERTGMDAVSSSRQPSKAGGTVPRPLSKEEIPVIADKYASAAKRAVTAGFDCIEVHCGHSYLISQFLSPIYNQRTDEYGGSSKNRARFPRMVLEKIRRAVGNDFPIDIRISMRDLIAGGNDVDDSLELLSYLDEFVDLYNVSIGLNDTMQYQLDMMKLKDGWRADLAGLVRNAFHKPVIAMGNIRSPETAERLLRENTCDIIGIGRGLIADSQWVSKVKTGNEKMLRKCISCNIGCAGSRLSLNRPIHCTINPDIIHNDSYKNMHVKHPINVVVIGAGPAGLEAACTAAEVGCTVFLLEEKNRIGGLLPAISKLPAKKRMKDFLDYLEIRSSVLNQLYILTGEKASLEHITKYKPDIIVGAYGSTPLLPSIPGLKEETGKKGGKVKTILGMLEEIDKASGKNVVIAGGGAVGLDAAEFFAEQDAKVTVIEMADEAGRDLDIVTKNAMKEILSKHRTDIKLNTKLLEVFPDAFLVERNGIEERISFDYGMICLGMQARRGDAAIEDYARRENIPYIKIGDARRARKIIDSVGDGRNILTELMQMGKL